MVSVGFSCFSTGSGCDFCCSIGSHCGVSSVVDSGGCWSCSFCIGCHSGKSSCVDGCSLLVGCGNDCSAVESEFVSSDG